MPMAPAYEANPVQAFPIHSRTFKGIAGNVLAVDMCVLHALESGTVTFHFKDGTSLDVDVGVNNDYGIGRDVESISSTGSVLIS